MGSRPNLVVIMVDDARADDLRPRFMPQANRLIGDQGARFTRFYAPFPLCCPARATLLTGQYAHNHGVLYNFPPYGFDRFDDEHTLATWLDPTYRTGMIGKYLNGYGLADPSYVPPGWDTWRVPGRDTYRYNRFHVTEDGVSRTVRRYSTTYFGDQAVGFVDDASQAEEPFFLFLSFVAPHDGVPHSDDVDDPLSPFVHPVYRDTYTGPPLPQDPSFDERDVSDKNPGVADNPRLTGSDVAYLKEKIAQRRESLRSVDDQVARVVGELAATGELDDTYVLLLSDNGFLLGEHRVLHDKKFLYDPTVRVPLQMRGPQVPAGRTVSAPTAQVDVAPTLLRLAGLPVTPGPLGAVIDGRSLLPALDNKVPARPIVLEEHTDVTPTGPGEWIRRGLVTDRFTYLRYPQFDAEELYDRNADRFQRSNVAADPAYRATVERMRELWQRYRWCGGAECRLRPGGRA